MVLSVETIPGLAIKSKMLWEEVLSGYFLALLLFILSVINCLLFDLHLNSCQFLQIKIYIYFFNQILNLYESSVYLLSVPILSNTLEFEKAMLSNGKTWVCKTYYSSSNLLIACHLQSKPSNWVIPMAIATTYQIKKAISFLSIIMNKYYSSIYFVHLY